MVMIFKSEKVRNFLLTYGEVYTFRKKGRKQIGRDWMNDGYSRPCIAYITISYCCKISPNTLNDFVEKSGFATLEEWQEEIKQLNKGELPEEGHLYYVVLREKPWYHKKENT